MLLMFSAITNPSGSSGQTAPPIRDNRPCKATIPEAAEAAALAGIKQLEYGCKPNIRKARREFENIKDLGKYYSVIVASPVKPTGEATTNIPGVPTPLSFGKWVDFGDPTLPASQRDGTIYSFVKWKFRYAITEGNGECRECEWLSRNTPAEFGEVGDNEFVTRTLGGVATLHTTNGNVQVIQQNLDITPVNFSVGGQGESLYLLIVAKRGKVAELPYEGSSYYWIGPEERLYPFNPQAEYPAHWLNQQKLSEVRNTLTLSIPIPPRIERMQALPRTNGKQDQSQNKHPQPGCDSNYCYDQYASQPAQHNTGTAPKGRVPIVVATKDLSDTLRSQLKIAMQIANDARGINGEEPWYFFVDRYGVGADGKPIATNEITDILVSTSAAMTDCASIDLNSVPAKLRIPTGADNQSARSNVDSFLHELTGHYGGLADVKGKDTNGDVCRSVTNPAAKGAGMCEPNPNYSIGPTPLDVTLANANHDPSRRDKECIQPLGEIPPKGDAGGGSTTQQIEKVQYELCNTTYLVTSYWVCWEGNSSGCRLAGQDRQVVSTTCLN